MNKNIPFSLFVGAVFMFTVSILPGCNNVDNDDILKKDGIKALGHIKDGSGKSGKYSEFFDIIVEFEDENGTLLTVNKSVTRSQFDSYSKDQQVMLVYSKKNPSIIKILSTPEEVQEFTGLKERDIAIADLNALVTMNKQNIDSCLNTITYGWEKKGNDSAWINERKHQYVRVFPNQKSVVYISGADEYKRFQDLVKQAGFHETVQEGEKGESERKTFENDSLFIGLILNRETVARTGTDIMSLVQGDREVLLSSVTLRKKEPATMKQ
jgi:hypothetical protein